MNSFRLLLGCLLVPITGLANAGTFTFQSSSLTTNLTPSTINCDTFSSSASASGHTAQVAITGTSQTKDFDEYKQFSMAKTAVARFTATWVPSFPGDPTPGNVAATFHLVRSRTGYLGLPDPGQGAGTFSGILGVEGHEVPGHDIAINMTAALASNPTWNPYYVNQSHSDTRDIEYLEFSFHLVNGVWTGICDVALEGDADGEISNGGNLEQSLAAWDLSDSFTLTKIGGQAV